MERRATDEERKKKVSESDGCLECADDSAWYLSYAPFAESAVSRPRSLSLSKALSLFLTHSESLSRFLALSLRLISLFSPARFENPVVFISRTDVKRGRGLLDKFVLFTIRVVDGRARWELEKHFSQFVALDAALRQTQATRMPPFPDLGHEWTDWAWTTGNLVQKMKVCVCVTRRSRATLVCREREREGGREREREGGREREQEREQERARARALCVCMCVRAQADADLTCLSAANGLECGPGVCCEATARPPRLLETVASGISRMP